MWDVVMAGLALAFFAGCIAYVRGCELL